MKTRLSDAAQRHDVDGALEEFFRLKSDGLTMDKLEDFYAECERVGGPEFRKAVQRHVSRYARARGGSNQTQR